MGHGWTQINTDNTVSYLCLSVAHSVFYPPTELCTDNGAMIALAGWARLQRGAPMQEGFGVTVRPRWVLSAD